MHAAIRQQNLNDLKLLPMVKRRDAKPRAAREALKPASVVTKQSTGRSRYKEEYCALVEELGKQGYSAAEIHAEIANGDRDQVERWKKAHATFAVSMLRARENSLSYWEKLARENAGNRDFNSNLYRIAMLGRFSAEYRESRIVIEKQPEAPVDLSKLSADEREQLAALLRKAKVSDEPSATADARPVHAVVSTLSKSDQAAENGSETAEISHSTH